MTEKFTLKKIYNADNQYISLYFSEYNNKYVPNLKKLLLK